MPDGTTPLAVRADAPKFSCSPARDLPIDDGPAWDGAAAVRRMLDAAGIGGDSPNPERARRGFLIYDSANAELRGSYHLPFADIVDGRLTAIGSGLRAAASRLPQMQGLSDAARGSARAVLDGYFAKMNQKQAGEIERRATAAPAPGGDPLEYVMSDETLDRHGTVLAADGWQLANFRRNPVALFGHDSDFLVGNWHDVRIDGGRLIGRLELVPAVSPRLQEIHAAISAGMLRAVSVGFYPLADPEPIDGKSRAVRLPKNELVEASLVAVPSNPNALQMARSLNLSRETQDLIFGEPAALDPIVRRTEINPGKTAAQPSRNQRKTGMTTMTLSQRIETLQNDITAKRDRLTELNNDDISSPEDLEAIEELTKLIDAAERELAVREAAERKIGIGAAPASAGGSVALPVPHIRRPFDVQHKPLNGFDLLVRAITVRGIAAFGPGDKTLDRVLDERYPGHEPTAIITRADQTIGTTGVAGWAAELVQQTWADFLQALTGFSIYPALRDRGIGLSFDGNGTVNIPSRTAGGAGGGFFAEGSPIRVGRITTASVPMTSRSMGVIVPFSRKLAMQSTPSIEALVRRAILEDTAAILDGLMLDATASDTARPAGLLNGVAAAASGYGGGDYQAVLADIEALMAPFDTANASDGIVLIMHPSQARKLAMMPGPDGAFGWSSAITPEFAGMLRSTHATANRLIALRVSDFATALGDGPQFDISEQATVHMEDTTPLEIVSGTGPTTADPVRSFWQTGTMGVRMIMDVSWMMRRSGMVQWIDTTTW